MPFNVTARRPWQRLVVAILAVAAAAAVRGQFLDVLGTRLPYVTFLPAVLIVVLYAGIPAGLLAALLSIAYVSFRIGPPNQILIIRTADDRLVMAVCITSCLALYLVIVALHRTQRRAAEAEAQFERANQRRRVDAKLRESDARYRALFDNSMDAVFLTLPGGKITAANRAARDIFGMTEEELCGAGTVGLLDQSDSYLAMVLAGGCRYAYETACLRRDGTRFFVELTVVNLVDNRNSFLILHDITGRKRMESEILALNAGLEQRVKVRTAELEEAIREQESFSYSVSHDLRAPLRHINSYSAILREEYEGVLPDEARSYLERISGATRKMGDLIDHLLELSRVARTEMTLDQVDLSGLALGIADTLRETEPERAVQFAIQKGLETRGDRVLLRQMVTNLMCNAWKYSSQREISRIEFGSICTDGQTTYFVKDNGVGFDRAYSDKLFAIFQRLHGPEFEGLGIGLATAQRIIHRHGGKIWAEGEVGAGASFFFTLP